MNNDSTYDVEAKKEDLNKIENRNNILSKYVVKLLIMNMLTF